MGSPLRIGVIGVGFGERVHVPAFRADNRCEVTAICCGRLENAAAAARRLGVRHSFASARQMLASGEVDAVSFAVPPALQPELIIAAAEAGKHVFCEKPVGADEAGAARAIAAVEHAGVVHSVDFIFPEIECWQKARSMLKSNAIGKLRHAALSWRIENYAYVHRKDDTWKTRCTEGGGTLANFVSHTFYYLEWLLGPISQLAARLSPKGRAGDARVDLWLEMSSGCPVTVSVAADSFLGSGHRLEIYGEDGTLVLENRTADHVKGFALFAGTREKPALAAQSCETFQDSDGRIGAVRAIAHRFIDGIFSGTAVEPNLTHGMRVQRLIAAARRADETGAWQSV
jgi:predicted dehydrogenase